MRILMVSHGYPPTISGVTLVVQKLAQAMARRGHSVTVVASSHRYKPCQTTDEGVRLIRIRSIHNSPHPGSRTGRRRCPAGRWRPGL